jgi:hypothetical protein
MLKKIFALAAFTTVAAVAGPASANLFLCTPNEAGTIKNEAQKQSRVHVKCSNTLTDGTTSVVYFAVPATDNGYASRFLSIATTALATGRQVLVEYAPGVNVAPDGAFGCNSFDCRYASGVFLK